MAGKTVADYLYQHAEERPEKLAVAAGGVSASYRRLAGLTRGYASYLKEKGLLKGDVVAVKASQTLDFIVAYLAVHTAGGIAAPLEKNAPAASVAAIARFLGAKAVISDEPPREDAVFLDSAHVLADAESTPPAAQLLPGEEDSADILFTTGTTGISKGVELSHRALTANAEKEIDCFRFKKDTVAIVPGPLNHAANIWLLHTTIVNGSTICPLNGMTDIKGFFDVLDRTQGSPGCYLPPAAIRTLFTLTGNAIGRYNGKLDFLIAGSAALPESAKQQLRRLLPDTRLYNAYGSSEAGLLCVYDYNACPGKGNSVGRAVLNTRMLVVDDDRNVIRSSRDNPGYLASVGPSGMKGYVNEPELTRQVMTDGVVYTNDIGYIDEDGFVYIIGRADDVINVGGLKVAPAEVEEAALSVDGIEDCICVPMPHPISGQAPKLLVVMREGAEFSPREISTALQDKLEGYKVPAKYEQVDSVARTYNGKPDRKAYRQQDEK